MGVIDDYIHECDEPVRARLREVQAVIDDAVPDAAEAISWGMPTYKLKGKNLIHFAAHKHHVGLYPGPQAIVDLSDELVDYQTSKGAIQLPYDKALPVELIRLVVAHGVRRLTG